MQKETHVPHADTYPKSAFFPVPGQELEASFQPGLPDPALTGHWAALVNALSGLSCASLGLLRAPTAVSVGRIRLQVLLADGNSSSAEGNGKAAG